MNQKKQCRSILIRAHGLSSSLSSLSWSRRRCRCRCRFKNSAQLYVCLYLSLCNNNWRIWIVWHGNFSLFLFFSNFYRGNHWKWPIFWCDSIDFLVDFSPISRFWFLNSSLLFLWLWCVWILHPEKRENFYDVCSFSVC